MGRLRSIGGASPTLEKSVSVLVPALNETNNLAGTVERLIEALDITVEEFELIIIDDGSTDGTGDVADRLAAGNPAVRVIHNHRNMGLGYSYKRGYEEASKEFYVYIPGDNTWPYRSFVELFSNIGRADIVTSYAINPEVRPWARRLVSRLYTLVLNLLFGYRMHYFNGLTVYPVAFMRTEPVRTLGFGFQAEVLLKALDSNLSYIEIPLPIDERASGASKAVNFRNIVSVIATVFRLFVDLRIRKRRSDKKNRLDSMAMSTGISISVEELGLDPDSDLSGRPTGQAFIKQTIVIAGASSGIGAALAHDLAEAEHRIFACSRNLSRLEAALSSHPDIHLTSCDIADEAAVMAFAAEVARETDHIDVLINCAGGFGAIGTIDNIASREWIKTIQDNLFGPFLTIKHFMPLLEQSQTPHIINFAGGGAFSPFPHYSAYACSKAAVVRLTETLAMELLPRGIAVNAIAPGLLRTRVHEATLTAGPEQAGVQFRRTKHLIQRVNSEIDPRMETVRHCVRALISPAYRGLTGKTISANFDPWASDAFRQNIIEITRSELYTMRRTNPVNLPDGDLRSVLLSEWKKHLIKR